MILTCSCNRDVLRLKQKDVDFKNYFTLEMPRYNEAGQLYYLPRPKIREDLTGQTGRFFKKHGHRFEYILLNKVDSLWFKLHEFALLKLDSINMVQRYCQFLQDNEKFNTYFNLLAKVQSERDESVVFSQSEMMTIASRFFYPDTVYRKDTTVGGHVCIGINGQKEFFNKKDYSVLEAFCFESIPTDRTAFKKFGFRMKMLALEEKANFTNYASFLDKVKQGVFKLMEEDQELKASLMSYYIKNRQNLGFTIE